MYYVTHKQEKVLNLVNKLGCIKEDQIKKITKLENLDKIVKSIVDIRNPLLKKIDDCYCSILLEEVDYQLINCIYVLTTLEKIDWFALTDFPYKLCFTRENKIFDILCLEPGKEFMQYQLIEKSTSNRIIIILEENKNYNLQITQKKVMYCKIKDGKAVFGKIKDGKLIFGEIKYGKLNTKE